MLRCFLLVLLSLYAVLPPGICACRLDALLWAALTEERLPDCIDDPYEHDHHCPGAKNVYVQADQPTLHGPDLPAALFVSDPVSSAAPADVLPADFAPPDFARPSLLLIVCALRI